MNQNVNHHQFQGISTPVFNRTAWKHGTAGVLCGSPPVLRIVRGPSLLGSLAATRRKQFPTHCYDKGRIRIEGHLAVDAVTWAA